MDCSMPGFPGLHYLLGFTQTHVHWVSDAIQSSHPLPSPSPPALSLSQHQGLFFFFEKYILFREMHSKAHFSSIYKRDYFQKITLPSQEPPWDYKTTESQSENANYEPGSSEHHMWASSAQKICNWNDNLRYDLGNVDMTDSISPFTFCGKSNPSQDFCKSPGDLHARDNLWTEQFTLNFN